MRRRTHQTGPNESACVFDGFLVVANGPMRSSSAGSNSTGRFPLGFVLLNALLFTLDHTDADQGEVKVFWNRDRSNAQPDHPQRSDVLAENPIRRAIGEGCQS